MDAITLWMALGFLFAGYAVIANDSGTNSGTWIASNNERFNWKVMWGFRPVPTIHCGTGGL